MKLRPNLLATDLLMQYTQRYWRLCQRRLSIKSAVFHYPVKVSAALAAYDLEVRYEIA